MAELRELVSAFGAAAASRAFETAQAKGVQVRVKTNVTPELVVYDTNDSSPSLLSLFGVRYRVEVVTKDGELVVSYGDPVSFNPVLAVALGAALFFAVTLIGASVARLAR